MAFHPRGSVRLPSQNSRPALRVNVGRRFAQLTVLASNTRECSFSVGRSLRDYLQAKISEMPSCFAIPFAVCTAVKKESSLTVFDC